MIKQNSHQGSAEGHNKKKEKKGHMALRNNVWTIRNMLWRELKPLEVCCIDLIVDRTIGWRQTEAKIKVDDFVEFSGKRKDEIYKALRSLVIRRIIRQRKYEHCLYFSLDDDFFGGLLIKRHEEALNKRKSNLKVVVDNSKNKTKFSSELDENFVQTERYISPDKTEISSKKEGEQHEIIEENRGLNTLLKDTYLNTLLKDSSSKAENKESFTLSEDGKKQYLQQMVGKLMRDMPQ